MPSDSSGLVTPPLQGGNPPPNLVTGAGGAGGAKPPMSRNTKIALGVGGFITLAAGAYFYAKHKSSAAASSSTTGTADTAPEVIAPSSDQDTLPAAGTIQGSGAGTYTGKGTLATELAQIQSEIAALQAGSAPTSTTSPTLPGPVAPTTSVSPVVSLQQMLDGISSPSVSAYTQAFTEAGLNPTEATVEADDAYNLATSGGGVIQSIPGLYYGNGNGSAGNGNASVTVP